MIRSYILTLLTVVCLLLTANVTFGQDLKISCTQLNHKSYGDELVNQFTSYTLFKTDFRKAYSELKNTDQLDIVLDIEGLIKSRISLTERNLLSSDYKAYTSGKDGAIEKKLSIIKNYKGNIIGDPTSDIRMSLDGNKLYGYIKKGKETIWIEPAKSFDASLPKNTLVVYYEKDVIISKKSRCASFKVNQQKSKTDKQVKSASSCRLTRMSIAMDYSYITDDDHSNYSSAVNQTLHIMNLVEGNYAGAFSSDIEFEVVEHFAPSSASESNNLFGTNLDATKLLDKFTQWGPSGFQNTHDIGQFWTSQNIYYLQDPDLGDIESNRSYGVAGLAWVNALCGGNRYHILEQYTDTDWPLRVLVAHEMGHNFGSGHDNTAGDIMAGSISINTSTWSYASKASINAALNGFGCLEECLTGSCSKIANIYSSGCVEGSPSTYDLSLSIEHAGGGGSTGFTVNVDGQSYPFTWESSPQFITIENLTANGNEGNPVSITANDGSDVGCGGNTTYDVPDATCSLYETEDFNDCSLPLGWEALTDNNITINNGDPLLQYAWKFDDDVDRYLVNYGAGSNANNSKTIDGTCMALMDDDINSASYFQGIVTLNTPSYNTLDYTGIAVKFDYNFHPFEDGKPANGSYFKVNVWDGSEYVNILTDTDSTCPWSNVWQSSCINSEAIDISQYSNANLHIQFVYSDGKTSSWTGMIALDNFEISGASNLVSGPCPTILTFTGTNEEGVYEAASMIQTSGEIAINSDILLDAPNTEINEGFEVLSGAEVSIMSEGCDNTTF